MKKILYTLAIAALFSACEKTTVVPGADTGKDTTVIVPGEAAKTENNTTVVNPTAPAPVAPAASETTTESNTTINTPAGASTETTSETTVTP